MTTTHTSSAPAETTDDLATASAPETGRWAFDADVADRFDDMLRRSIPQYDVMRKVVTDAALHVLDRIGFSGTKRPGVVDLGASRGEALAPIVDRVGVRGQFLACDVSEPTDLYWGLKRENGYAQEAIERKALALEGVLVPLTARIDEQWLRDAGFDVVETVWRYLNFVGFVAVKRR
jgi:hypothetical protein